MHYDCLMTKQCFDVDQVAPAELEAVLLSHAGVADAGVVGLPDAMSGELPVAMVVLRNTSSASEKDLLGYVAGE